MVLLLWISTRADHLSSTTARKYIGSFIYIAQHTKNTTRAPWRRGRASVCEIHIDSSDSVLEWGQLTCIALIHGQNVDSAL